MNHRAFLPTIQTRPWAALRSHKQSVNSDDRPKVEFAQSASLLHLDYGKTLDRELMACDAFYALSEIFTFCACSEAQFLHMIENNISRRQTSIDPEDLIRAQSNLTYTQELLDHHVTRLRSNVDVIKARGGPQWTLPASADQQERCAQAADALQKDFESLVARTCMISDRCKNKINQLASQAMLAESKKAIQQAEEVTKLTRLAFIFVPLSFTASWFGMNLDPLVEGTNPLWVWFVVSIPIFIGSVVFMHWDVYGLFKSLRAKRRARDQPA